MSFPFQHRRSQSEVHYRFPDDFDLELDPFDAPSLRFKDPNPPPHDDLLSSYIDSENSGSNLQPDATSTSTSTVTATAPKRIFGEGSGDASGSKTGRVGHRRSSSADESSCSLLLEGIEAKKAMSPDKLAELWTVDPKRAKRILANRQSAARSKEKKACYVLQLERKIHTLQIEATTLSAQLSLFQRDTAGLTTENTELRLHLQAMEQQAKLCDALNEALKKEVDRLKIATGEIVTHADTYGSGMHQLPYSPTSFFSHQPQQWPGELQTIQMPQLHGPSSNVPTSHRPLLELDTRYDLLEAFPSDPIGQFQGLDISHGVSHVLMPDVPSIFVNKINNAL